MPTDSKIAPPPPAARGCPRASVGLAALGFLAALAPADGSAHPPRAERALLVEARPDGRWVVLHLVLTGLHRHDVLGYAAGPELGLRGEALARLLAPRALHGVTLEDADGPIDLARGEAAARRSRDRVEVMILLALEARGAEGLVVRLEEDAEPLFVEVLGQPGRARLTSGRSSTLVVPPTPEGGRIGER